MPERLRAAVTVQRGLVPDVGNKGGLLFDRSPLVVGVDEQERGGFRFTGRSVEPIGRPTLKGFQEALALACEFYESSPYWIGALVAHGESREEWSEKLDQAMSVTTLARKTLLNLGYLYRHSTEETRTLAPTPGHLDVVAALEPAEQREWLDKARREEMPIRTLRREVQAAARRLVLDVQAATMHTVDLTVRVSVEASTAEAAKAAAWESVKLAIHEIPHAHVIAATALPQLGALTPLANRRKRRAAG